MSITQFQGVSSLRGLRGLVDNNGQPTDAMIAWMTKVERTVTQLGVTAKALTAPPRVANIDPAGVVQAAGVDFTIAYTNKSLSNVPDGAARKAVLAVDANQRPLIDFTQAHLAKNLLNVADDPGGGRSAWATAAQKTAAVDGSGNLLLKNIQNVPGVTSGPTTSSTTPAVIPELDDHLQHQGQQRLRLLLPGLREQHDGRKRLHTDLCRWRRGGARVSGLISERRAERDYFRKLDCHRARCSVAHVRDLLVGQCRNDLHGQPYKPSPAGD